MIKNCKRREAIKTIAAAGGLLMIGNLSFAGNQNKDEQLANGWSYQGQPCVIYQQGQILLLINERGSVGSAIWVDDGAFVVLGGDGWDAGLTAQVTDRKRTINWSNNTVWTRTMGSKRVPNLPGNWLWENQPCAIFQQNMLLLLVNQAGQIGAALWTVNDSFFVIGGNNWNTGLIAQVTKNRKTINWSNGATWVQS